MIVTRRLLAGLVLGLAAPVLAGCTGQPPPEPPAASAPDAPAVTGDPLRGLVAVALRRIVIGDQVSAAKFGTPSPIDDPPREQQVLAQVGTSARRAGVDPNEAARFFADQIEASKVVQRGLYQRWTQHPDQAPASRPDLRTQIRPELDTITTQLIEQLKATVGSRHSTSCPAALAAVSMQVGGSLDPLHRDALGTALRGVCVPG
jgi:chorismate mutase